MLGKELIILYDIRAIPKGLGKPTEFFSNMIYASLEHKHPIILPYDSSKGNEPKVYNAEKYEIKVEDVK